MSAEQQNQPKRKVLLMGKSGAGKTSMRSIIFANYLARDTIRLGATFDVEHSHVRFLGNLVLNIWDCGGQDAFMDRYLSSQRDHIFRNVEVMIYLFDIESPDVKSDLLYYRSCVEAIMAHSKDAKIFCLVHKMDLVPESAREKVFSEKEKELVQLSLPLKISTFSTSIWDETLYGAWSSIVYSLIPNVNALERSLDQFCKICEADEVVLFERATFLVICHATHNAPKDQNRFEKISNIVKHFKLSCSKAGTSLSSMEVRNSQFSAFLDHFTDTTHVCVLTTDPRVRFTAVQTNVKAARAHFEKYLESGIAQSTGEPSSPSNSDHST
eukprot:CAMPEP_0201546224 /NCGR_PEP_ID=MMETSP0173_2-20130828/2576_1 /ASSEMBLY_ACC=CAM_ASM_000268 /TAXON_ID=218659 /ORGANISM="Vexillifera sp., Strain DIVA3 564/2" /LENGTH=325 /DNA_ID=CAMNT_0047954831 /DNA_START=52 /DNA_END=1025 /DNA_ORIENTATION=-